MMRDPLFLLQSVAGIGSGAAVEYGSDYQGGDGQYGHEGEGKYPHVNRDAVGEVLQPTRYDDGGHGAGQGEADQDHGAVADICPLKDGCDAGPEYLAHGSLLPAVLGVEPQRARMAAMTLKATTRREVRISFW